MTLTLYTYTNFMQDFIMNAHVPFSYNVNIGHWVELTFLGGKWVDFLYQGSNMNVINYCLTQLIKYG